MKSIIIQNNNETKQNPKYFIQNLVTCNKSTNYNNYILSILENIIPFISYRPFGTPVIL